MLLVTDKEFDAIISEAMDHLPPDRIDGLKNIAITYSDKPTPEQRQKLKLRCDQTLYGLYEGTPLTSRPAADSIFAASVRLPDKITIFKLPIVHGARTIEEVKEQVRHTLWHEIAHYYGLDHKRIHELE
ncbi:MAG: metallopeptidase family protein [Candidatus Saccharimonadales bacterium]